MKEIEFASVEIWQGPNAYKAFFLLAVHSVGKYINSRGALHMDPPRWQFHRDQIKKIDARANWDGNNAPNCQSRLLQNVPLVTVSYANRFVVQR